MNNLICELTLSIKEIPNTVEELDKVKEVQSGANHFEHQLIRANHPKGHLAKSNLFQDSDRGKPPQSSMSPTIQRTINQESTIPTFGQSSSDQCKFQTLGASHLEVVSWQVVSKLTFKVNISKVPTDWGKMSHRGAEPLSSCFQTAQTNSAIRQQLLSLRRVPENYASTIH